MTAATVYSLEIFLLTGNMTRSFVEENPVVSRAIRIRGSQTLHALHGAIFRAFNRFEDHMYEFQVGGKRPSDKKSHRYERFIQRGGWRPRDEAKGTAFATRIDDLKLKKGDEFFYWFDFGDDWWHIIRVAKIGPANPGERLPRVIARKGASPPQYPDLNELEEED